MKTEPLLGAAAFGAVAAVLYNLYTTVIAVQSPTLEGLGLGLNCFIGLVTALVTGFLCAYLHRREAPLTAGVGAKGGLAAGVLAFAINGVVSVVIAMLLGSQCHDSGCRRVHGATGQRGGQRCPAGRRAGAGVRGCPCWRPGQRCRWGC